MVILKKKSPQNKTFTHFLILSEILPGSICKLQETYTHLSGRVRQYQENTFTICGTGVEPFILLMCASDTSAAHSR